MSETLALVQALVARREIRVSLHGARELAADEIGLEEIAEGIGQALLIEDYPGYFKGPCVLVLQRGADGQPIHVLWGLEKGTLSPAVLITAYRPDPEKWMLDFMRRRP